LEETFVLEVLCTNCIERLDMETRCSDTKAFMVIVWWYIKLQLSDSVQ